MTFSLCSLFDFAFHMLHRDCFCLKGSFCSQSYWIHYRLVAKASLQISCAVLFHSFALSSQNKNLNLMFAHILPPVSVSSFTQFIAWQQMLTCRVLFLPTSTSMGYVMGLIWLLKHSCHSCIESTSSLKGTLGPRDCWWCDCLFETAWREKSKAWSILETESVNNCKHYVLAICTINPEWVFSVCRNWWVRSLPLILHCYYY